MSNSTTYSGGVGFFGLFTIVLVTLKLLKLITISWWLCFLPLLVAMGIALLVLGCILGLLILAEYHTR